MLFIFMRRAKRSNIIYTGCILQGRSCKDLCRDEPDRQGQAGYHHVTYGNRKINYYIKKNNIAKKDRTILKKYVETDCKLLCAVVTAPTALSVRA